MTEPTDQQAEQGFAANHLIDPPFVYVWIPVAIVCVIVFLFVVCACAKPGRTKGEAYHRSTLVNSRASIPDF
jgi:hypothetical protein